MTLHPSLDPASLRRQHLPWQNCPTEGGHTGPHPPPKQIHILSFSCSCFYEGEGGSKLEYLAEAVISQEENSVA